MSNGVETSAGARIDRCSIEYHWFGDEVEFRLGGISGFELHASEDGLRHLVAKGTEALASLKPE